MFFSLVTSSIYVIQRLEGLLPLVGESGPRDTLLVDGRGDVVGIVLNHVLLFEDVEATTKRIKRFTLSAEFRQNVSAVTLCFADDGAKLMATVLEVALAAVGFVVQLPHFRQNEVGQLYGLVAVACGGQ
jgi:hypothetical protein